MRFWDSSALVPPIIAEPASPTCRQLLRNDSMHILCARQILSNSEHVSLFSEHSVATVSL